MGRGVSRQVKRHLEFVDQLVKDKAELSSRCERLVEDLKLLERKFDQRLQEAEERAQRELKKQRESILAAEKMRRDAWMQARAVSPRCAGRACGAGVACGGTGGAACTLGVQTGGQRCQAGL